MKFLALTLCIVLTITAASKTAAQSCDSSASRHAQALHGEVMGKHNYVAPIGRWLFWLESSQYGWDLRLRDGDKMDLSQITPPFNGPNPRQIYGWHFRNDTNTGENDGEVNAPQLLRLFQFSTALSGTGGYRPPLDGVTPMETDPSMGRGALTIDDMGLADLEPGQKARLNYLKFHACLTWPKTDQEIAKETNDKSPVFLKSEQELMASCGLEFDKYKLSAWILPRWLSSDNGKNSFAPIVRRSDAQRGIAICHAGSRLSVLGYDTRDKKALKPKYYNFAEYLDVVEAWEIGEDESSGSDLLILSQIEKSEVAVAWDGKKFTSRLVWHLVEN